MFVQQMEASESKAQSVSNKQPKAQTPKIGTTPHILKQWIRINTSAFRKKRNKKKNKNNGFRKTKTCKTVSEQQEEAKKPPRGRSGLGAEARAMSKSPLAWSAPAPMAAMTSWHRKPRVRNRAISTRRGGDSAKRRTPGSRYICGVCWGETFPGAWMAEKTGNHGKPVFRRRAVLGHPAWKSLFV